MIIMMSVRVVVMTLITATVMMIKFMWGAGVDNCADGSDVGGAAPDTVASILPAGLVMLLLLFPFVLGEGASFLRVGEARNP